MNANTNLNRFVVFFLAALIFVLASARAIAVPPPAGSVIGNQATATYTDATGTSRTSTSNLVQTTVTQVFSHTLTADQSKRVAPGGTVYFAHTLVNTGNGTDTYTLSSFARTTGSTIIPSSTVIYADANGDGVPDNSTAITSTGPVTSGGNFKFVVASVLPATEASGNNGQITVGSAGTAGDTNNYTASDTLPAVAGGNTDTVTVTANAAINVTKSFSVQSGGASGTACVTPFNDASCVYVRVTLTYTNTGQAAATNVILTDLVGTGATANFTYVPDTTGVAARRPLWSGSSTTLTDAAAGDPSGIDYDFNITTTNAVTATIGTVAAGQSGTLSFSMIVKNATPAGDPVNVAFTANTARFCYDTSFPVAHSAATCSTLGTRTNTATYTVATTLAANVVANNSSASAADAAGDNVVTVASANQGSSVNFVNFIWNTGNVIDRFNITVDATNATPSGAAGAFNAFPAGTTYQLFSADGAGNPIAPLTDTNGDGVPDTGPVAAGAFVRIVLRVNLLPNTLIGAAPGYSVNKVATSAASGVSNSVTDRLTTIDNREIDLANGVTAGTYGTRTDTTFNLNGAGAVITTVTVTAGGTANFLLWVTNNGPGADNFDLIVRQNATSINTTGVATNDLPANWTVRFVSTGVSAGSATCPANGQVVTNTGSIISGGACEFRAEIGVPITQTAINQDVFFRVASPVSVVYGANQATSASYDTKVDRVTVTAVGGVTLQPNRSGQVFPGGNIVYTHQLCNTSGTSLAASSITVSHTNNGTAAGWTNAVYIDANGNGVLDVGTDTQVAAGGTAYPSALAGGICVFVFDNVFAPAGATAGASSVVQITATHGSAGTGIVSDTTNVITGDLALTKEQATVSCTAALTVAGGVAGYDALGWQSTNLTAQPAGNCIAYRITATNSGSSGITNLVVSDAIPQFTTHETGACEAAQAVTGAAFAAAGTAPADEALGQVATSSVATVASLAVVRLYYCVQLDQ